MCQLTIRSDLGSHDLTCIGIVLLQLSPGRPATPPRSARADMHAVVQHMSAISTSPHLTRTASPLVFVSLCYSCSCFSSSFVCVHSSPQTAPHVPRPPPEDRQHAAVRRVRAHAISREVATVLVSLLQSLRHSHPSRSPRQHLVQQCMPHLASPCVCASDH